LIKRILIVGGNGFLGHNLAKKLSKLGYNLFLLCRKKNSKIKIIKDAKYIYCDISNKKRLFSKLNFEFSCVVNLSGNIDHQNKDQTIKTHYFGLKNLVNGLKKSQTKLFIQAGSSLEYGNLSSPQKEKKKCKPISSYGKAKYLATKFLLNKKRPFKIIILRPYQIYGPEQKKNRLTPMVIDSCLRNKNFKCSEGYQKRDFLYVDDFTDLIIKIIKKKKVISGIYNVGSGTPISVRTLINCIKKISKGGNPLFGSLKMRSDEISTLFPDIKKIKSSFKWAPKVRILAGLKKTIKFYEKK
tara:strand:+ start:485 stop:1378 length:894 start_codon:yes stop_codon:yes gene_type:complete